MKNYNNSSFFNLSEIIISNYDDYANKFYYHTRYSYECRKNFDPNNPPFHPVYLVYKHMNGRMAYKKGWYDENGR